MNKQEKKKKKKLLTTLVSAEVITVFVAKIKSSVSMEAPGKPSEKKLGLHSLTSVLMISCRRRGNKRNA